MEKQDIEVALDELGGLLGRRAKATARARALLPVVEKHFKDLMKWESYDRVAAVLNAHGVPAARGGKWQRPQVMRLLNIGEEHSVEPQQYLRIKYVISALERHYPEDTRNPLSKMYYVGLNERFEKVKAAYEAQAKLAHDIQFDLRRATLYSKGFE